MGSLDLPTGQVFLNFGNNVAKWMGIVATLPFGDPYIEQAPQHPRSYLYPESSNKDDQVVRVVCHDGKLLAIEGRSLLLNFSVIVGDRQVAADVDERLQVLESKVVNALESCGWDRLA
ncbi:uncharacterized protein G2W53_014020 [Senna tora]|uniref:Uncharacterized protein n=1 Tax=Senna tora TaxID=362788 RepID=A0A834U1H1_9FABA|nr:uncharacterized protein G2W53_014020 [Senna tora]